jgi:hypothetical protein
MPNQGRPMLVAQVCSGRFSLAPSRCGGTHLFWQGNGDSMAGVFVVIMSAMRGLRGIEAGRSVLRSGYGLYSDRYRHGHWFCCTLVGAVGDYSLSPNQRALYWHDASDLQSENGLCSFEPEVASALLARATQRRAASEAVLRSALARTGMRR